MEQRHEIKMEFNGTKFTMRLDESEIEALEKEMNNMNECCRDNGEEPDWTMCSSLRMTIHDGIRNLKKAQETKAAADAGTPNSQEKKDTFGPLV